MGDVDDIKKRGGMIALLPADPAAFAVDGGEQANDIHLTLQFLGEDVTGWDAPRRAQVVDAARAVIEQVGSPIDGHVAGHATFNPTGGPDGDRTPCAVHLVSDDGVLAPLQASLTAAMASVLGDDHHRQHTPFLPHITGAYGRTAADLTYCGPVRFDRAVITLGDDTTVVDLAERARSIAETAREAFAHGWALTGAPLTARLKAAALAAVEFAVARGGTDTEVWETTLVFGTLEGTWAAVMDRREQLIEQLVTAVCADWAQLVTALAVDQAVDDFLRRADQPLNDDGDREAAAAAVAIALLHALTAAAGYRSLRDTIAAALRAAQAEGVAAGAAITAEQNGQPGFDFDTAYADAYRADTDAAHRGDADRALSAILAGAAGDVGRQLLAGLRKGLDTAELVAAVQAVLSGVKARAARVLADWAVGRAFTDGLVRTYRGDATGGPVEVDYVTAGDGRVCQQCQDAEDASPYPIDSAPMPPLHPNCRCILVPRGAADAFLT